MVEICVESIPEVRQLMTEVSAFFEAPEAIDDKDLCLSLQRRIRSATILVMRGTRDEEGYRKSNHVRKKKHCFDFVEFVKTGVPHCLAGMLGRESKNELGEQISIDAAAEKFNFPFLARFFQNNSAHYLHATIIVGKKDGNYYCVDKDSDGPIKLMPYDQNLINNGGIDVFFEPINEYSSAEQAEMKKLN